MFYCWNIWSIWTSIGVAYLHSIGRAGVCFTFMDSFHLLVEEVVPEHLSWWLDNLSLLRPADRKNMQKKQFNVHFKFIKHHQIRIQLCAYLNFSFTDSLITGLLKTRWRQGSALSPGSHPECSAPPPWQGASPLPSSRPGRGVGGDLHCRETSWDQPSSSVWQGRKMRRRKRQERVAAALPTLKISTCNWNIWNTTKMSFRLLFLLWGWKYIVEPIWLTYSCCWHSSVFFLWSGFETI